MGKGIEVGDVFGRWTVLDGLYRDDGGGKSKWLCRCRCETERLIAGSSLRKGTSRSCGCLRGEQVRQRNLDMATPRDGDVFGRLTVVEDLGLFPYTQRKRRWKVRCTCECGNEVVVWENDLKTGHTQSCGCLRLLEANVTVGERYGRWEVIAGPFHENQWRCRCECGTERLVSGYGLLRDGSGGSRSCGCLSRERFAKMVSKHGGAGTSLYGVYTNMIRRCYDPNNDHYQSYGGRGIKVSGVWRYSFRRFAAWAAAGYRSGLTIERINNNGNYEPSNCTWVPPDQQRWNKQNTIRLTAWGDVKTLREWSLDERCVVSADVLRSRYEKGWEPERAIITPPKYRYLRQSG
jgi:hypothetical protein